MNLVNEQDLLVLEISYDCGQIAFYLQQGRSRGLKVYGQLVGDDVSQRRLAQAWRAVEQHVIHGLPARASSLNRYSKILFDFGLADELAQTLRTQLQLKRRVILDRSCGNYALAVRAQIGC